MRNPGIIAIKSANTWRCRALNNDCQFLHVLTTRRPSNIDGYFTARCASQAAQLMSEQEAYPFLLIDCDQKIILFSWWAQMSSYLEPESFSSIEMWPIISALISYQWRDYQAYLIPHSEHFSLLSLIADMKYRGREDDSNLNSYPDVFERELAFIFSVDRKRPEHWCPKEHSSGYSINSAEVLSKARWDCAIIAGLSGDDTFFITGVEDGELLLLAGGQEANSEVPVSRPCFTTSSLVQEGYASTARLLIRVDRAAKRIEYADLLPPLHPRYIEYSWNNWKVGVRSYKALAEALGLADHLIFPKEILRECFHTFLTSPYYVSPTEINNELLEYLTAQAYERHFPNR